MSTHSGESKEEPRKITTDPILKKEIPTFGTNLPLVYSHSSKNPNIHNLQLNEESIIFDLNNLNFEDEEWNPFNHANEIAMDSLEENDPNNFLTTINYITPISTSNNSNIGVISKINLEPILIERRVEQETTWLAADEKIELVIDPQQIPIEELTPIETETVTQTQIQKCFNVCENKKISYINNEEESEGNMNTKANENGNENENENVKQNIKQKTKKKTKRKAKKNPKGKTKKKKKVKKGKKGKNPKKKNGKKKNGKKKNGKKKKKRKNQRKKKNRRKKYSIKTIKEEKPHLVCSRSVESLLIETRKSLKMLSITDKSAKSIKAKKPKKMKKSKKHKRTKKCSLPKKKIKLETRRRRGTEDDIVLDLFLRKKIEQVKKSLNQTIKPTNSTKSTKPIQAKKKKKKKKKKKTNKKNKNVQTEKIEKNQKIEKNGKKDKTKKIRKKRKKGKKGKSNVNQGSIRKRNRSPIPFQYTNFQIPKDSSPKRKKKKKTKTKRSTAKSIKNRKSQKPLNTTQEIKNPKATKKKTRNSRKSRSPKRPSKNSKSPKRLTKTISNNKIKKIFDLHTNISISNNKTKVIKNPKATKKSARNSRKSRSQKRSKKSRSPRSPRMGKALKLRSKSIIRQNLQYKEHDNINDLGDNVNNEIEMKELKGFELVSSKKKINRNAKRKKMKRKGKKKRKRLRIGEYPKTVLENWFQENYDGKIIPDPDLRTRNWMSSTTGISELKIQKWFRRRRKIEKSRKTKNEIN
ncbi:nucleolar protein [Anaeramoeba flamelloides]|uniref:Nucleolar protein n=1 Tax=Anaeramoeba flamelloides TaxID=1746091 RepID=A0ABQ8XGL2_9EUKA|nr:nucleolar protein [Anaeramoeba flamelloides]